MSCAWTESLAAATRASNGKIYGVPSFAFVNWMYYRADWFKEAGLEPPETFDEFQNAAVKLSDPSKNRFGFGMRGAGGGEGLLIEVIRSFGSPIVDDKGQPAMDRQKATDAVRWYSELHTKYHAVPPSVTNGSFQQIMTGFTTGQTPCCGTTPARSSTSAPGSALTPANSVPCRGRPVPAPTSPT